MRALRLIVAALTLAALGPAGALATTVLKVDTAEMTSASQWVVNARVVTVANVDLRDEGAGLFTDVTLAIDEVYKGHDVPGTYVLRLIGGHGRDGLALTVPGMPRFKAGEQVVLFLEPTQQGHVPCGLGQGVWRVNRGQRGETWVQQSSQGLHMMKRNPSGRLEDAHAPQLSQALTLGQLIAEVYAAQLAPQAPPY